MNNKDEIIIMSDFIYSKKAIEKGYLSKKIRDIYHKEKLPIKEYHGEWGSLAVSKNIYNGFQPLETNDYIFVIIGGPILNYKDNYFLKENNSNTGTKEIYKLWKKQKIKWDEDLSGPFAIIIINKKTAVVEFVTDIMSFIPIYMYRDSTNSIISTHVDVLARVSGQNKKLDIVSSADFILNGYITFPYTLYQGVYQVKPASIHYFTNKLNKVETKAYWEPKEEYKYKTINGAAKDLIKGLKRYVNNVTSEVSNIAQFISGGEDSRVLSALLQKHPREAFVFLDHINREGKMAEKAATAYGANFNLSTRSKTHYIEILPYCSDLVGSGSQYHHAHTYNFHKICGLDKYSAVFGGLFSDALLKGARIRKVKNSNRFPLVGDVKDQKYMIELTYNNLFTNEIIKELNSRRSSHYNYIKQFRSESAKEWFELWPSSMNKNIPNLHANRRLFKSYEPFLANDIVKISATVPQNWKLNRRLFHKAVKPLLKPTKYVFHTDGRLPYYPWYINSFIQLGYRVYRKIGLKRGVIKGNQGPWGEWKVVLNSEEWQRAIQEYSNTFKIISIAFKKSDVKEILIDDNISRFERVNLMQVLYQIESN